MLQLILNNLLPTVEWWEYSWHPSLAEFGGMLAFMFWWGLASLIFVIPLGILILLVVAAIFDG